MEFNINDLKSTNEKFYLSNSVVRGYLISGGILILLAGTILPSFFVFLGRGMGLINLVVWFFGIRFLINFKKEGRVAIETFNDHMLVAQQFPQSGKISQLIIMYKVFSDKIPKSTIPYRNITAITESKDFWTKGQITIHGHDDSGRPFEFLAGLSLINKKEDLPRLIQILKQKGIPNVLGN